MSLVGPNGAAYRVTSLAAQAAEGGKVLNLVMHLEAQAGLAGDAAIARNVAAATALLSAHPELRQGFDNIYVLADAPGTSPVVVQKPMSEIVAAAR